MKNKINKKAVNVFNIQLLVDGVLEVSQRRLDT